MNSSVIFIGTPEKSAKHSNRHIKRLFRVAPNDLAFRVWASFVPPFGKTYQQIYVDLLGPILGVLFLIALVVYGSSFKRQVPLPVVETVAIYVVLMPVFAHCMAKIGKSSVKLTETVSLIGYGFYGHIFTLLLSFLVFREDSNFFFFFCLIVFSGLSTLRIIIVFLKTIPVPAVRFLVCLSISLVNVLSLVLIHFLFMHKTYIYRNKS